MASKFVEVSKISSYFSEEQNIQTQAYAFIS